MKAEADAAAAANRKLAADKARRREQQSLVARGAPSLGDEQSTSQGLIHTNSAMKAGSSLFRGRLAQSARYASTSAGSLISRGAPGSGGGGGGGGGSGRTSMAAY